MQSPDTTDAPIVPNVADPSEDRSSNDRPRSLASDGGRRPPERPFDRPPRTDHATPYTRDEAEIEPLVADLR